VFFAIFGIMMYNHFASKTKKGGKALLIVVCDILLVTFVCSLIFVTFVGVLS
jgi:hypothetical protein